MSLEAFLVSSGFGRLNIHVDLCATRIGIALEISLKTGHLVQMEEDGEC